MSDMNYWRKNMVNWTVEEYDFCHLNIKNKVIITINNIVSTQGKFLWVQLQSHQ